MNAANNESGGTFCDSYSTSTVDLGVDSTAIDIGAGDTGLHIYIIDGGAVQTIWISQENLNQFLQPQPQPDSQQDHSQNQSEGYYSLNSFNSQSQPEPEATSYPIPCAVEQDIQQPLLEESESGFLLSQDIPQPSSPNPTHLPVVPVMPAPPRTDQMAKNGHVAVCPNCGIVSENFHKCVSCKKEIPLGTKIIKDPLNKEIKVVAPVPRTPEPSSSAVASKGSTAKRKKPTPAQLRNSKGGGKRECIVVLSSDDEESPKTKISKTDSSSASSGVSSTSNDTQNSIAFPHEILEKDLTLIKKNFGKNVEEINFDKANELLVAISGKEVAASNLEVNNSSMKTGSNYPLATTAATNSVLVQGVPNTTASRNGQIDIRIDTSDNKTLLSYKGIAILQQDILCLASEQFLNDSILDFWLRYIENEILSPEDKARTYIFSTFFYKRLTTKPKKTTRNIVEDSNLTNAERRHARVARWTKNVDLFEKDFIIIPINESCHWFLAVICYPGLNGVHNFDTGELIPGYRASKKKAKKVPATPAPSATATQDETKVNGETSAACSEQEAVGATTSIPIPNLGLTDSNMTPENIKIVKEKIRIKQPCILILDSLAGDPRNRVYSTLREYLKMEYKTRKGEERDFTKQTMPGDMPKVIQQPNHCDCGIFTLFYVEYFFRKPITSFEFPIEDGKQIWSSYSWETKREKIYNCIKGLVKKSNPDDLCMIPRLIFPSQKPKKERAEKSKDQNPTESAKGSKSQNQLKQIESAPVEKVEKVPESEEPMDVDVEDGASSTTGACSIPTTPTGTPLKQSVVEMTRASPADNDHDHDYTPIPSRSTSPTSTS